MLFNSVHFAIFLPIVFFIYWTIPDRHRWILLLLSSYYFYMSWSIRYIALILLTTVISYYAAILMERAASRRQKKLILTVSLFICCGILFVFKYLNFFFDTLTAALRIFSIQLHPMTLRLLLPVGISFYTFQSIGYVIDVYRGDILAERHLGVYATFVSFFPQLVAGPIERTKNLLPQITAEHTFDYDQASYGLKLMTWGFFKKLVIADHLAPIVDRVFNDLPAYHGFSLVLALFFFTIQIYCDFSGYSDIARGTAKLLGIELMENFKSPYLSTSIREFWSRWHISLSTWFRDYIYIPLGGNRVGRLRHYRNLLVTFLVSGLWHGADWTFVIWGGIHGGAQILEHAAGWEKIKTDRRLYRCLRVLLVTAFVMLAWLFFRAQSLGDSLYVFRHMLAGIGQPVVYLANGFSGIGISSFAHIRIAGSLAVLLLYDYASLKTDVILWVSRRPAVIRHGFYYALVLGILFFHAIGEVAFVYFQF